MRPLRLSLISLPVLLAAVLAGCSVRTERTVYTPTAAAPAVVVPASGYYYPARYYYYPTYEAYHPAYYSSY